MIKSLLYASVVALGCMLANTAAVAQARQMFSWTDENGVVHFSDTQPEGQEVRVIDIPASPDPVSGVPETAPDAVEEPSLAQKRRDDIARRRQEEQAIAAENKSRCTAMRAELARLEPNRRVYFTNDKGETERMDDVVRTDRVAELHALIPQYCK